MSVLTGKQQSFIEMMKTNDEFALRGFQLLLQREDHLRFFDPLQEAGFFAPANNPAPVHGERENTVRIPYWPPLEYLKVVARHVGSQEDLPLANKIIEVIRTVSAWRDERGEPRHNYQTNRTFAEILGMLPTKVIASSDLDLLEQWLSDPYDRMLTVNALDSGLLPRLLDSTDPEDWKKAARVLHHVTGITWQKDSDESEPTPTSVVDDFWLGELLKHHAKQIGRKAGVPAAETMLSRIREVFGTSLRRDYSSVFRPAIEEDLQNYQWRSVENRVVEGLRDVVLGLSDQDHDNARLVIKNMLNSDLEIIRRIGIHVLAQQWLKVGDLYNGASIPGLFKNGHVHELYGLLRDHFSEMDLKQKEATLAAIEGLPNQALGGESEQLRRYSQYRWLSAINGKGYPPADKRFSELDADPTVGKLTDHPDFDTYITSWVGPGATPYSPEELMALTKSKLVADKLNQFRPSDDPRGLTSDGLASSIGAAAETNPDLFFENLTQFLEVTPHYQHALIEGLKRAWDSKTDANWDYGWDGLVSFFEKLLNNESFWQQAGSMYQHWVVTAIADCLRAGTKSDDHAYNPRLLPRTQLIIDLLLQREPGVKSSAEDTMFQAMNAHKGRIVESLYSQALHAARVSDQHLGNHQEAWKAIKPLFDRELAQCKDTNYEFSTLSGCYLPQLQYLDSAWTAERIDEIFPVRYEANNICALDGLAYAAFTKQVYELLASRDILERALGLELKGRSARGKLLERIGAAYLWGLEVLEGPRFRRLFDTAKVADLHALTHFFWVVRNNGLAAEQHERILAFWERSLEWAKRQEPLPTRLMSAFGLLATHMTDIGRREQHLLESVAPHVHIGHETYEFVAELLRLAPKDPATVAKVLKSMIIAHPPEYDYQDRLRSLLQFLAEHGQREEVILIIDKLRHLPGIQALFKSLTQP